MASKPVIAALVATIPCVVAAGEPITPIRPVQEINLARAELGNKLYFDPRLSKCGFISCNSCRRSRTRRRSPSRSSDRRVRNKSA